MNKPIAMIVAVAAVAVVGIGIYSITQSTPSPVEDSSLPEEPSSSPTIPVPDEYAFLFSLSNSQQNGEQKRSYEIDKPITTDFVLGNAYVDVPSGVAVDIVVSEINSGNIIDNTTVFTNTEGGSTIATYSFTPTEYGKYKVLANATYNGISSDYGPLLKVVPGPKYTFEVEGKTSTVTVDSPADFDIRSVSLDAKAKKLSIEIEKLDSAQRLDVRVPYELLGDPYTVLTEGEPVNMGDPYGAGDIYKADTYAIFRIKVDETVSHIDIIGTTAIPEFSFGTISIVMAVTMTCVALMASRLYIRA